MKTRIISIQTYDNMLKEKSKTYKVQVKVCFFFWETISYQHLTVLGSLRRNYVFQNLKDAEEFRQRYVQLNGERSIIKVES